MKILTFSVIIFSFLTVITFAQTHKAKPIATTKIIEASSIIYSDSTKYHIAFLRKGNLWIMFENGTGQRQLTSSGKVISLTCKESNIFFGEMDGLSLIVRCININDIEKIERAWILNSSTDDFFIIEKTEFPRGEMGWVSDNILGVSGNYECCDAAGFRDAISINLETNQINHTNLFESENHIKIINKAEIGNNYAEKNTKPFFTKKTSKEYELYYLNDKNQEVKISSTQQYTPRTCWEENVTDFSYILTPSGKIVYWFIIDCGDLAYSVLHIANKNGTNQIKVTDGFMHGYENYNILKSNGAFVILLNNASSGINNLVTFIDESNEKKTIVEDIDYFELVQ